MCEFLGRVERSKALAYVYENKDPVSKSISDRKLAFFYASDLAANKFKQIKTDFQENRADAKAGGFKIKQKITMVILDSLQVVQRIIEAVSIFLRFSLGVALPSLAFRKDKVSVLGKLGGAIAQEVRQVEERVDQGVEAFFSRVTPDNWLHHPQ